MALPSAMKHFSVLESAGLVQSHKIGRMRMYLMTPHALTTIGQMFANCGL